MLEFFIACVNLSRRSSHSCLSEGFDHNAQGIQVGAPTDQQSQACQGNQLQHVLHQHVVQLGRHGDSLVQPVAQDVERFSGLRALLAVWLMPAADPISTRPRYVSLSLRTNSRPCTRQSMDTRIRPPMANSIRNAERIARDSEPGNGLADKGFRQWISTCKLKLIKNNCVSKALRVRH